MEVEVECIFKNSCNWQDQFKAMLDPYYKIIVCIPLTFNHVTSLFESALSRDKLFHSINLTYFDESPENPLLNQFDLTKHNFSITECKELKKRLEFEDREVINVQKPHIIYTINHESIEVNSYPTYQLNEFLKDNTQSYAVYHPNKKGKQNDTEVEEANQIILYGRRKLKLLDSKLLFSDATSSMKLTEEMFNIKQDRWNIIQTDLQIPFPERIFQFYPKHSKMGIKIATDHYPTILKLKALGKWKNVFLGTKKIHEDALDVFTNGTHYGLGNASNKHWKGVDCAMIYGHYELPKIVQYMYKKIGIWGEQLENDSHSFELDRHKPEQMLGRIRPYTENFTIPIFIFNKMYLKGVTPILINQLEVILDHPEILTRSTIPPTLFFSF